MTVIHETAERLAQIPGLSVTRDAPLHRYTRFGLGGPAAILADAFGEQSFLDAWSLVRATGLEFDIIGGGTNLVVHDCGFDGVILRYAASRIEREGTKLVADAGAMLQDVVDYSIALGLAGIHTMTGIPGWVGGAIYGNAGAYGRSMHQNVTSVRFFDGVSVREFDNAQCRFRYRTSTFKDNKGWVVFSAVLNLTEGNAEELRKQAGSILSIRNAKYPPTMKCAGSIFKNLIYDELPEHVKAQVPPEMIREGKVPSAYFLEAVGAKGIANGDIRVADYHANLIYNAGQGTALQVREIIVDLKQRVRARFRFDLEEEVQYVGFS